MTTPWGARDFSSAGGAPAARFSSATRASVRTFVMSLSARAARYHGPTWASGPAPGATSQTADERDPIASPTKAGWRRVLRLTAPAQRPPIHARNSPGPVGPDERGDGPPPPPAHFRQRVRGQPPLQRILPSALRSTAGCNSQVRRPPDHALPVASVAPCSRRSRLNAALISPMRERLRKIAQRLTGTSCLLGVQPQVVGIGQHLHR